MRVYDRKRKSIQPKKSSSFSQTPKSEVTNTKSKDKIQKRLNYQQQCCNWQNMSISPSANQLVNNSDRNNSNQSDRSTDQDNNKLQLDRDKSPKLGNQKRSFIPKIQSREDTLNPKITDRHPFSQQNHINRKQDKPIANKTNRQKQSLRRFDSQPVVQRLIYRDQTQTKTINPIKAQKYLVSNGIPEILAKVVVRKYSRLNNVQNIIGLRRLLTKARNQRDTNQQSVERSLHNGIVSLEELHDFLDNSQPSIIDSLNPRDYIIRNILKNPLQESWHRAKEELAGGDKKHKLLMRKIWEFRQWHHNHILQLTKQRVRDLTGDPDGLKKWSAAGSETLTSDIDVNLKGNHTELAVRIFNQLFQEDGWSVEAGVAYDVNVYAMDFMHKFGGVEVNGHNITEKEGKRQGQVQGGFLEERFSQQDKEQQDEWALVKLRLYISNPVQWDEYVKAAGLSPEKQNSIEEKYKNYLQELYDKMSEQAGTTLDEADDLMQSGMGTLNQQAEDLITKQHGEGLSNSDVLAENLLISSSNRIYEEKLAKLAEVRKQLKVAIDRYNEMVASGETGGQAFNGVQGVEMLNGYIELKLKALRKLVSECALYSNEAYITDAAVYHTVVGLQGGNAIQQTKAELMQAITENMGDALKEISRHNNTLGEAALKSGKYIWRMADAAKNMGYGKLAGVADLYHVGFKIANQIKGIEKNEKLASTRAMNYFGINTANQLVAKILTVGTKLRKKYSNLTAKEQQSLGRSTPQGKKVKNRN